MVCIEFCGIPGSGKTTICDKLEKQLLKEGFSVRNLQKRNQCSSVKMKINKIISNIKVYINYQNICLGFVLIYYALRQKNKRSALFWANRILEINWLLKKSQKYQIDYVLFDEGPIQFVTSLFHEGNIPNDTISKVLKGSVYNGSWLFVNCFISMDASVERLKRRNRKGDRFATGTKTEIFQRLEKKKNSIDFLLTFFTQYNRLDISSENEKGSLEAIHNCILRKVEL